MEFSRIPICHLIPQRPPFMMVDRVLSCDDTNALTEFSIREDNILIEDGKFSSIGIIENAAQSCAARMGCVDLMHGEPIKIGYIGDMRNTIIHELPKCGERIYTFIHVVEDFSNLLLAEVTVKTADYIIATTLIKVAKTDIVANLNI